MINILFICHGNICRSPMAEFYMKDLVRRRGLESRFFIGSAGTSSEEIGNGVHRGTKEILTQNGIEIKDRRAVQVTRKDYEAYDYLVVMDQQNLMMLRRIIREDLAGKVSKLLDHTDKPGNIADPWYTGDFQQTYEEVALGCQGLLDKILAETEA